MAVYKSFSVSLLLFPPLYNEQDPSTAWATVSLNEPILEGRGPTAVCLLGGCSPPDKTTLLTLRCRTPHPFSAINSLALTTIFQSPLLRLGRSPALPNPHSGRLDHRPQKQTSKNVLLTINSVLEFGRLVFSRGLGWNLTYAGLATPGHRAPCTSAEGRYSHSRRRPAHSGPTAPAREHRARESSGASGPTTQAREHTRRPPGGRIG